MRRCAGCGIEESGFLTLKRCACRRVYFCGPACMGGHAFCRAKAIVARWKRYFSEAR